MEVKQLYTYPIKSLQGTSLPSFIATYQGFKYDRRFMLLRAHDLKNMHIAHHPEMCLFYTQIHFPESPSDTEGGKIVVEYRGPELEKSKTLDVPLQPRWEGLEEVKVTMHSSPTTGFNMGKMYNDWFSECFGYEVIFAYIGNSRREVLGNVPPAKAVTTAQKAPGWLSTITASLPIIGSSVSGVDQGLAFADCAPYLVVSEKSWANAQSRLPPDEALEISKFRPNIVVTGGGDAFEEDFWAELVFDDSIKLVLTQNCARCTSLNVDYRTGKFGVGESGKILKKLQSDRRVDPGMKYSPIFGRYGFLDQLKGGEDQEIRVGMSVKVAKRNQERTRFEWPNLSTN